MKVRIFGSIFVLTILGALFLYMNNHENTETNQVQQNEQDNGSLKPLNIN